MSTPQNPGQTPEQGPQNPGQPPAYGYPHPYQQPAGTPVWGHPAGFTPTVQPPRKRTGRNIGIGCGSILVLVIVIGIIAAVASSGSSNTAPAAPAPAAPHGASSAPAKHGAAPAKPKKAAPKTVTFKVWGTAPEHGIGPVAVTYGSDTDSRQGAIKNGSFTGTVPYKSGALEYNVTAVLQGSGDIHCSVTVDGHTKTGHASGGYADCDAMLTNGPFGDWS